VFDRSGQSIFSRPKPIDLSAARQAGYTNLDFDIEDEAESHPELSRPLIQDDPVLFDAGAEQRPNAALPMS
jgi:hypothetical protein